MCRETLDKISKLKEIAQFIESYSAIFSAYDSHLAKSAPLPNHIHVWLKDNMPSLIKQSEQLTVNLNLLVQKLREKYGD